MTYPNHVYLTFGGNLQVSTGTVDQWSCGIRLRFSLNNAPDRPATVAECEEYLNEVAVPALKAWFVTANAGISSNATLAWVKANSIGPEGRYLHEDTVVADIAPALRGAGGTTAGTPLYPFQVSLALTTETAANRGYASKGAIYLPSPRIPLGTNGQFSPTDVNNVVVSFANLLDTLGNTETVFAGGETFIPSVISPLGNNGAGTSRHIVRVSADTRPDVQRRRSNRAFGSRMTSPEISIPAAA